MHTQFRANHRTFSYIGFHFEFLETNATTLMVNQDFIDFEAPRFQFSTKIKKRNRILDPNEARLAFLVSFV